MEDFPRLKPSLTFLIETGEELRIGQTSQGANRITMTNTTGGRLTSIPEYDGPVVDAQYVYGADWVKIDPDLGHARLDFQAVCRTDDDALLYMKFDGFIKSTEETRPILLRDPEAKTTPYGCGFLHGIIETGSEKYKRLENCVWVATQRLIVEKDKPLMVEWKVSEVVHER